MIIVEGLDGAGKSTLCEMLKQHNIVDQVLPSPRIPAKGNEQRMKYETDRYIRLYAPNNRIAIDRFLFSEMAYGPVLRNKNVFTRAEYLTHLLELMMAGSIVIFCMPEKLNFKSDENPEVIKNIDRLRNMYQILAEDCAVSNPRTIIYKWDSPNAFKELTTRIKGY